MKRLICTLLSLIAVFSLAACGNGKSTIDPVLAQRRDAAESYMRSMLTVLWSPEEDILYTLDGKKSPEESTDDKKMLLKADRIYRGMPYAYAGSTLAAFMEYAGQPDSNGVIPISDLPWIALSRDSNRSRIGLDGSSSLMLAWAQIGRSFTFTNSADMTQENGYLHVGDYETDPDTSKGSLKVCNRNGQDVMFAAYAQLQKADGVFTSAESGSHTMMVVSTHVVKDKAGNIDGDESYVITLEQSKYPFQKEEHAYDEQLGAEVYAISTLDEKHTFNDLFSGGYLPITCKELINPAPLAEVKVNDSNRNTSMDVFMNGYVDSNYHIDTLTVTITDKDGNIVQQAALRAPRYDKRMVAVNRFEKDKEGRVRGTLDYTALEDGKYHCALVCRLVNGQEFTTRDFSFEKGD